MARSKEDRQRSHGKKSWVYDDGGCAKGWKRSKGSPGRCHKKCKPGYGTRKSKCSKRRFCARMGSTPRGSCHRREA